MRWNFRSNYEEDPEEVVDEETGEFEDEDYYFEDEEEDE
jgi:hypothetical protein